MIHHISISAQDPERVARVIAELWQAEALPFPPFPGAYIVVRNDGHGTAIEVSPLGLELRPGEGDQEVQPRMNDRFSPYTATHAAISVEINEERIREIAAREGWRVGTFDRGGAFRLIEFWVEDRFMLELLTPAMARRYLDVMTPEGYAEIFQLDRPRAEEQLVA
jgi:hypothetical protein